MQRRRAYLTRGPRLRGRCLGGVGVPPRGLWIVVSLGGYVVLWLRGDGEGRTYLVLLERRGRVVRLDCVVEFGIVVAYTDAVRHTVLVLCGEGT